MNDIKSRLTSFLNTLIAEDSEGKINYIHDPTGPSSISINSTINDFPKIVDCEILYNRNIIISARFSRSEKIYVHNTLYSSPYTIYSATYTVLSFNILNNSTKKTDSSLNTEFEKIKVLNQIQGANVYQILAHLMEEIGEVAQAIGIENSDPTKAYKNLEEPAKSECVDIMICTLSLFEATGGTANYFNERLGEKLKKWEQNIKEA